MVMPEEKVLRDFSALPQDAQQQVIDFIAFLQTRYKPISRERELSRKKIGEESFVGMWKNRTDMSDSSAWVRNTRQAEWVNRA